MSSHELPDQLGSLASTACTVHCAIRAFLPVMFRAIGAGFLLTQSTE